MTTHLLQEPNFQLELASDFEVQRDGQAVSCICSEPLGVLTLTTEDVTDPQDLPNLSRMLAGFLTRSGHPVATDELLAVSSVPKTKGFSWQYLEDERYFRFWLLGNMNCWVLLNFVCREVDRAHFHPLLQDSLKTLRLRDQDDDGHP